MLLIKIGDIVNVQIEKLTFGGDGLARFGEDKFVIFVENSVVFDELSVQITQVNKRFARGKIVEIIKPSEYRIKPFCPIYNACGSCNMQNYV